MTTHTELLFRLYQMGMRAGLNWWCEKLDVERAVWEYDLMSPTGQRRGAFIVRRWPDGTRVFVEMDGDRLEAELARIAGLDRPEPPQDAAEHLARERARPEAEEAYEEWLREAEPEPFTPEQRAWIIQRIERAVEAARLGAGADSVADVVWPEGGGEIDF